MMGVSVDVGAIQQVVHRYRSDGVLTEPRTGPECWLKVRMLLYSHMRDDDRADC